MTTNTSTEIRDETTQSLPFGLSEEIDLLEYIAAIFRNKYRIVFFSWFCDIAAYGLTYLQPILYESFTKVTIIEPEDLGGVSPDTRKVPEILTLVEHGFILGERRDNYIDVMIATLKSRKFTTLFIQKENIMSDIFYQQWDPDKKEWKDNFKPGLYEAFNVFDSSIRFVNYNQETGLLAVRMRYKDPTIAAKWANRYVDVFNQHMRNKSIESVRENLDFLNKELQKTYLVEMQKAIYRLIEAKTALQLLENARKEYVLKVIDPAVPATKKSSPIRTRMAILACAGGFMMAIALVIARVIFLKIKAALKQYD